MPVIVEVALFLVDLDAEDVLPSGYEALLSREEKERAAGFRFATDRRRYVCMHGILRTLLSSHLDADAAGIVFRTNEYGKPCVLNGCEFNISYSAGRGLIGLARVPIGVDIELVDPEKITPEMIEEVFGAGERESFFSDSAPVDVPAFFRGWVRKESVVKAMGTGVSYPLRLVQSGLDRESYSASYDDVEYFTCSLAGCGPGYEAALTVAGHPPEIILNNRLGQMKI
jgi:4'-phosphopantetheinyl transferase